jgi:cell division septation protein DedD
MKDRQIFFYSALFLAALLCGCAKDVGQQNSDTPSYRIVGKDGKAIYIERKRPKLNEDYIAKKKMEEGSEETQNARENNRRSSRYSRVAVGGANALSKRDSSAYSTKSVIDDINEDNDLESFAENLKRGKSNRTITDFDYLPQHYFTDDRKNEGTKEGAKGEIIGVNSGSSKNDDVARKSPPGPKIIAADNFVARDYGVKNLALEHSRKVAESTKVREVIRVVKKSESKKLPPVETEKVTAVTRQLEDSGVDQKSGVNAKTGETDSPAETPSAGVLYYVQLGTFLDKNRADTLLSKFQDTLPDLRIEEGKTNGGQLVHKVLIGGFSDKDDLNKVIKQISDMGHREIYVFKK